MKSPEGKEFKDGHYVYIFKTPCMVEYENRDGIYHLCKVGHTVNFKKRKLNYDLPFSIQLIEIIEFPDKETAMACELMLHWTYPEYRLKRDRRMSEWMALNNDQIEHLTENLAQFKDVNMINNLLVDAPIIREEIVGLSAACQYTADYIGVDFPHKPKSFAIDSSGF